MGLKEGTLGSLVNRGAPALALAESVFPQMLRALDCIAWKGIIHRDVKLENILYISLPDGRYQFQLGDFGLCNHAIDAKSQVGSELYMALEMLGEGDKTSKVDVWSLFVTMLWTLDAGGFRWKSNQFSSAEGVQEAVLPAASSVKSVSKIREMVIVDPEERASAGQMLVKHSGRERLITPRNRVPALTSSPLKIAAARALPGWSRAPTELDLAGRGSEMELS
jgi:serine/threonine protein kinase